MCDENCVKSGVSQQSNLQLFVASYVTSPVFPYVITHNNHNLYSILEDFEKNV